MFVIFYFCICIYAVFQFCIFICHTFYFCISISQIWFYAGYMRFQTSPALGKVQKCKIKKRRHELKRKKRTTTYFGFSRFFMSRVNSQNSADWGATPPWCSCLSSFNFCHCIILWLKKYILTFFAYSLNIWWSSSFHCRKYNDH